MAYSHNADDPADGLVFCQLPVPKAALVEYLGFCFHRSDSHLLHLCDRVANLVLHGLRHLDAAATLLANPAPIVVTRALLLRY